jgi:hypothetical protein
MRVATERYICASKVKYLSIAEARRGKRHVRRVYGQRQRIYHCPHCDGWHLTSQMEKRDACAA